MTSTRFEKRLFLIVAGWACACAGTLMMVGCFSERHLVGEGSKDRGVVPRAGSGGAAGGSDGTSDAGTPGTGGNGPVVVLDGGAAGRGGVPVAMDASPGAATVVSLGDTARLGWPITISPEEVARRLSQFLLRRAPSTALVAAVVASAPRTNEDVGQLADGLLLQDNSVIGRQEFYRWWLNLDAFPTIVRDATLFPALNESAKGALVEQTLLFAEDITWRPQGDLSTLLTEPAAFVSTATAPWFPGTAVPAGTTTPLRVMLDATRFAGMVTQPAVVATADRSTRANPSSRGMHVRTRYLCQPIPPEPADVTTPPVPDGLTLRQWLLTSLAQPQCAACHVLIDPPGLAFGHFDAIGAFQETERGLPVDTSGTLNAPTTGAQLAFDGAPGLANHLAQLPEVRLCFAAKWLAFASAKAPLPSQASVVVNGGPLEADAGYIVKRATIQGRLNLRGTIRAVTETHTFLDP